MRVAALQFTVHSLTMNAIYIAFSQYIIPYYYSCSTNRAVGVRPSASDSIGGVGCHWGGGGAVTGSAAQRLGGLR